MTSSNRRVFRVDAKASSWGTTDGRQDPIVRLHPKGGKGTIAIDYSEIPKLIAELAMLLAEQQEGTRP